MEEGKETDTGERAGERKNKKPEAGASGSSIFYTIILIKRIRHEALPCGKVIQMRYVT